MSLVHTLQKFLRSLARTQRAIYPSSSGAFGWPSLEFEDRPRTMFYPADLARRLRPRQE